MSMRIQVDQARCHGHQMCAIAAPKLFGSDEIGNAAVLIAGDVPAIWKRQPDAPKATVRNARSKSSSDHLTRGASLDELIDHHDISTSTKHRSIPPAVTSLG